MNKLGFIGFGSMGSMLVRGLINTGYVRQEQIIVTRKNKSRLDEIKDIWKDVNTTDDIIEVVKEAKYIFICVKPLEYMNILENIESYVLPSQHIISIAGSVTLEYLDRIINCKITKVMPTITSEVNEGISLICHNSKVSSEDAENIESMFKNISKVKQISEKDFGIASEFTSCGPGLIASIFDEFVEAGLRHTNSLRKEDIQEMVLHTLMGTAKLMLENNMSFEGVISRVATKGGITEEGVKVLESGLPPVFSEMFTKTMNKRKVVSEKVSHTL